MNTLTTSSFWFGVLTCFVLVGCSSTKTKVKQTLPLAQNNPPNACIRGKVVNEEGQGIKGVLVKTTPSTDSESTNSRGFFEICNLRVLVNEETGMTVRKPLPHKRYTLVVLKDGFHARPKRFFFQGKALQLRGIVMVEKTRPLPGVQGDSNDDDVTQTDGNVGKVPYKGY